MRSGIILAGGKSSRMGKEKGLIEFDGKPLILWVVDELSKVVDELIVSVTSEPSSELIHLLDNTIPVIPDELVDQGPIQGLINSLNNVSGEYTAIAPCDSPFINSELYEMMFEEAENSDGAIPMIGEFYEPLNAVYFTSNFLKALGRVVSNGGSKPIDAYEYLNLKYINETQIKTIDPFLRTFININTEDDLKKAMQFIKKK